MQPARAGESKYEVQQRSDASYVRLCRGLEFGIVLVRRDVRSSFQATLSWRSRGSAAIAFRRPDPSIGVALRIRTRGTNRRSIPAAFLHLCAGRTRDSVVAMDSAIALIPALALLANEFCLPDRGDPARTADRRGR